MTYAIIAVLVLALIAVTVRIIRHRGFTLQEVAIYKCAASQGEDFVEVTVGGCRLRRPLEVVVKLDKRYDRVALAKAIWHQAAKLDPRTSAVRYQGNTYSF